MRMVLAIVAALLLVVGVADEAAAKTSAKKHKQYAKKPAFVQDYGSAKPYGTDAFVERNANKLPFGSAAWWEQMQREGRLGGEIP